MDNDEMVERVARAIAAEVGRQDGDEPLDADWAADGIFKWNLVALAALEASSHLRDLQVVEFRLALSRITQHYPPDTIAGRLAADALAKYPNRFERADRENDCEPFYIPEIKGLPHGSEASHRAELVEALTAVRAYYFLANPSGLTEAHVCDLVCAALATLKEESSNV